MKTTIVLTPVLLFIASLSFAQSKTKMPKNSEKEISKNKTALSIYPSVKIGTQEWMIRNLYVDKFADGSIIPEAKSKEEWILAGKNGKPAWCYYDFDKTNADDSFYGKHYNWYAVNDPRGLAPKGWKIPTEDDWFGLIEYSGGWRKAGSKLKSVDNWHENGGGIIADSIDIGGRIININKFNGRPSGVIGLDGYSDGRNKYAEWWSTTKNAENKIIVIELFYRNSEVEEEEYNMGNGCSVRCIKK